MKISQKKYLFPIKYSWRGIQEYLVCCHKFIVRNSFRKIYFFLSIFLFTDCDKVLQDVSPPQPPVIPQASTEVFKQIYPEVASFIFKPLEPDKTWQTEFVSPRGKVLSLVDYHGEIIDLNELVGATKTLPNTIKQYIFSNNPTAQITMAYVVMKSSTQTDGYKLTIQVDKNNASNLFFDANNGFLRVEKVETEKVSAINFTSTDQVNFDSKIPIVVKQFISNNQLKDASMTIYELTNTGSNLIRAAYKIILNFRERPMDVSGVRKVTIKDTVCLYSGISNEIKVTIRQLPTAEITAPKSTFCDGEKTTIASKTNSIFFQWQKDGKTFLTPQRTFWKFRKGKIIGSVFGMINVRKLGIQIKHLYQHHKTTARSQYFD